jgi:uncharacterized protein (TIGR03435 family)
MSEPVMYKLASRGRSLFNARRLASYALMTFILSLIIVAPRPVEAQAENASAPIFDVVSIKPEDSGIGMAKMMFESDGYNAENTSLKMLIEDAYGVEDNQIAGAPEWAYSEKYDIEAKINGSTTDDLSRLNGNQRKLAHQRMLQALLSDRFKLTIHHETKDLPIYWLVSAKDGPKLHEAKPGDNYSNGLNFRGNAIGPNRMLMQLGGGQITGIAGQGMPLADLVTQLSTRLGREVVDKTGLTVKYDLNLQWTSDASSIFSAIQEQLGLKLESQKGPVDILNIDYVEKPSGN